MQPGELELYSTEELVGELLRRQSFLGVVVHSEQELRSGWDGPRVFKVRFNANLSTGEVRRLLDVVSDHIESESP